MMPLAIPAVVTVAVLQFIQIWGDLLIGLLFLQYPEVRTITVGLATLQSSRIIPVTLIMAGSILSLLPAVIIYLFFQRQLISRPHDGDGQVTLRSQQWFGGDDEVGLEHRAAMHAAGIDVRDVLQAPEGADLDFLRPESPEDLAFVNPVVGRS